MFVCEVVCAWGCVCVSVNVFTKECRNEKGVWTTDK